MKYAKKIVTLFLFILCMCVPVSVMAQNEDSNYEEIVEAENNESVRSTEEIKYYYRIVDGKLQYRRWNVTRGYWIDATWLDA